MKKFRVGDFYEDWSGEIIGETDDYNEAVRIKNQRIDDTDGECDVWIYAVVGDSLMPIKSRKDLKKVLAA